MKKNEKKNEKMKNEKSRKKIEMIWNMAEFTLKKKLLFLKTLKENS